MNAMNLELQKMGARILLALVGGIWQGALLTLLVAVVVRWLKGANAATRHAIWLATLGLVCLLVPANFWSASQSVYHASVLETDNSSVRGLGETAEAQPDLEPLPAGANDEQEIQLSDLDFSSATQPSVDRPKPAAAPLGDGGRVALEPSPNRATQLPGILDRVAASSPWNIQ